MPPRRRERLLKDAALHQMNARRKSCLQRANWIRSNAEKRPIVQSRHSAWPLFASRNLSGKAASHKTSNSSFVFFLLAGTGAERRYEILSSAQGGHHVEGARVHRALRTAAGKLRQWLFAPLFLQPLVRPATSLIPASHWISASRALTPHLDTEREKVTIFVCAPVVRRPNLLVYIVCTRAYRCS
jgi:hypothetical protein